MRIPSAPAARAAICLLAAAVLVSGCASHKLAKLIIATGGDGTSGSYDLAGTLPDQPTHGRIYRWPSTKTSQSDVVKLASVLGLSGTPIRHAHGWDLKTAGGELRVRDDQGQLWRFGRPDQSCGAANFDIDEIPGDAPAYECATDPGAATPANGPGEASAKAVAASLLTALGVSGDEQFNASAPMSYISVSPSVADLPTQGIELNIEVDAHGVAAASGHSAPTAGDDYPLRTAKAAFDSLGWPILSTIATPGPMEIAGAYMGLAIENATSAGATILVPTWFFTLADGRVAATAIAVDPAYIGSPPPTPASS